MAFCLASEPLSVFSLTPRQSLLLLPFSHTDISDFSCFLDTVNVIEMSVLFFQALGKAHQQKTIVSLIICSVFLQFSFIPIVSIFHMHMAWWQIFTVFLLYSLLSLMTWLLFALLVEPQVCTACAHRSLFAFQGEVCFIDLLMFEPVCGCVH